MDQRVEAVGFLSLCLVLHQFNDKQLAHHQICYLVIATITQQYNHKPT